MAGRRWRDVGDRLRMMCVVARGRRHPVLGRGGQWSFAGGWGEHLSWLVGVGWLWVIVCGWCMSSIVAVVIPCIRSGALAIVVLSLLGVWRCLPWCGDGFVVGRRVVVAVGGVVDVVVVG